MLVDRALRDPGELPSTLVVVATVVDTTNSSVEPGGSLSDTASTPAPKNEPGIILHASSEIQRTPAVGLAEKELEKKEDAAVDTSSNLANGKTVVELDSDSDDEQGREKPPEISNVLSSIPEALNSMDEGMFLNDEAINCCLQWEEEHVSSDVTVLSSYHFKEGPDALYKRNRVLLRLQRAGLKSKVIASVNWPECPHWGLLSIDLDNRQLDYYDSIRSETRFRLIQDRAVGWMNMARPGLKDISVNSVAEVKPFASLDIYTS